MLLVLSAEELVVSMEAVSLQTTRWAAAFKVAASQKSWASTEVSPDTAKHWSVSDRLEESVQQLVDQHRLTEAVLKSLAIFFPDLQVIILFFCLYFCDCTKVHMTLQTSVSQCWLHHRSLVQLQLCTEPCVHASMQIAVDDAVASPAQQVYCTNFCFRCPLSLCMQYRGLTECNTNRQ